MRILLTNDDGIDAPGLKIMEDIARDVAGEDGEVWIVAPAGEKSGVGHCISYVSPARIEDRGHRRFAVDGYPADCVLAGLHDVMKDARPDLILSGVNRGNNSGENTLYSGTIGATIEGALQGVPSIALSQFYGPSNRDLDNSFEAAATHGARVVNAILSAKMANGEDYNVFYNVNFPPVAAADVKGIRAVSQGRRPGVCFTAKRAESPSRRTFLWIGGGEQAVHSGAGTDVSANIDGYISVTPMRCDLTARDLIEPLAMAIDNA